MACDSLPTLISFSIIAFFYTLCFFRLVENMLDKPRFSGKLVYLFAILNPILMLSSIKISGVQTALNYSTLILVVIIEFFIYFKNHFVGILTCVFSVTLHIMTVRAIVISIGTIILHTPSDLLIETSSFFWWTINITFILCGVATILVIKFIPQKYLRIINQSPDQILFLCVLSGMFNVYMILNGTLFHIANDIYGLAIHQILISLTLLLGVYVGVFMLIRFVILLEYKEKNEMLEKQVDKGQTYINAFMQKTLLVFDVNCTNNIILDALKSGIQQPQMKLLPYNSFISIFIDDNVIEEDKENLRSLTLTHEIIKQISEGHTTWKTEYRVREKDGHIHWYECNINASFHKETKDVIALITISDIQDKKLEEEKLRYLADRDSLVGAYNKAATEKFIKEILKSGAGGTLLLIDLDNFKGINDSMGHLFGDEVLKLVYSSMSHTFREIDILGRIGGDEFMVFMKDTTETSVVSNRADTLCKSVSSLRNKNGDLINISVSVGLAIAYAGDENDFETLYKNADIAMYHAKSTGKNAFSIYKNSMHK